MIVGRINQKKKAAVTRDMFRVTMEKHNFDLLHANRHPTCRWDWSFCRFQGLFLYIFNLETCDVCQIHLQTLSLFELLYTDWHKNFGCFIDWLADCQVAWLSVWLPSWLSGYLTYCLAGWRTNCLADWLTDWLTEGWSMVKLPLQTLSQPHQM